jgi:8-oxo-dGTP pyrophosphatase MutT (NUDIX family)
MRGRIGASVNAYLVLRRGDEVLLHLRQNTGYSDGMWSLIAGHVEDTESATLGMIREAKEEIGIDIKPEDLQVVHIIHRQSNRLNIDIFFSCSSWQGTPENCEPDKCKSLEFFPLTALPHNTVPHNVAALNALAEGRFYSEQGWSSEHA